MAAAGNPSAAQSINPERAVAFREFLAVLAVDERDMRPDRHRPAHGVVDHHLARGVVQVIVAPDHVGDAHVVVVDDHGKHVGGRPVGAEHDHVVEL